MNSLAGWTVFSFLCTYWSSIVITSFDLDYGLRISFKRILFSECRSVCSSLKAWTYFFHFQNAGRKEATWLPSTTDHELKFTVLGGICSINDVFVM